MKKKYYQIEYKKIRKVAPVCIDYQRHQTISIQGQLSAEKPAIQTKAPVIRIECKVSASFLMSV